MVGEFTMSDLKNILVNRIGLPEDEIPDDEQTTFEDIGLDSLAFLEIQLEMEQRFGFRVEDEDAQKITTFSDAIAYTNRRLREG